MDTETKIKKAHITLMRHPETCLYSGVIMAGKVEVRDDVPTAKTNGWDTKYGRKFVDGLNFPDTVGLVFHENLHKALRHIARHLHLWEEDAQIANAASDYVANDLIMCLNDKAFCKLPEGGLYHPKFHNWSVREVYDFLKTGRDKDEEQRRGGKPGKPGDQPRRGKDKVTVKGEDFPIGPLDEHDTEPAEAWTRRN